MQNVENEYLFINRKKYKWLIAYNISLVKNNKCFKTYLYYSIFVYFSYYIQDNQFNILPFQKENILFELSINFCWFVFSYQWKIMIKWASIIFNIKIIKVYSDLWWNCSYLKSWGVDRIIKYISGVF